MGPQERENGQIRSTVSRRISESAPRFGQPQRWIDRTDNRRSIGACIVATSPVRRQSFLTTPVEGEPTEPFEQQRHVGKATPASGAKADAESAATTVVTFGHFISTLTAGVGSGVLSSITCAPLDLVRTRMQVWGDVVSTNGGDTARSRYASAQQVLRDIYRAEGFQGCFRGLGATLVTVPLFWGVYFPLYDGIKQHVGARYPDLARERTSLVHCGAAVATGAVADIIVNPLFVVRTRLQTQALHAQLEGLSRTRLTMREAAAQLYQQGGFRIFYRGMTANFMGLSHVAVQFPAYERLKKIARRRRRRLMRQERESSSNGGGPAAVASYYDPRDEDEHHSNISGARGTAAIPRNQDDILTASDLLLTSGCAKMCASLLTYPHEVLRSRMMDSRATSAPTLAGTLRGILASEGLAGLYSGLQVALLRVVPNCCITFVSYEYLLRYSRDWFAADREGGGKAM